MRTYLPALLLVLLLATAVHAAVIRGVVVENLTGKPLARSTVTLQPVAGTPGATRSLRANNIGGFEFDSLAAGTYIMKASRKGFMALEYGQKRWNSSGTPLVLEESAALFLSIRLLRYSAIQGSVVDENDVGMPDHDVVAYRNSKPPVLVVQATTDDRGAYRLPGLEPGTYVVRTAGKRYDDEAYLPTFSTETEQLEQARTIDLAPEQDAERADIRPFPGGRFFNLSVDAASAIPGTETTLTLASELGRKTLKISSFRCTDLPAGDYEVYAETHVEGSGGEPLQAGYQRPPLGHDAGVGLLLQPPPPPPLVKGGSDVTIGGGPADDSGKLWVRRKDLAGVGAPYSAQVVRGRATIPIGRWEVMLEPPSGYYVSGFSGPGASSENGGQGSGRADGWNEVLSRGYAGLRFSLSAGPGAVRGLVKLSGDPVAGVPVFLEAYDSTTRSRVADLRIVRTDQRGQYYFGGLAPGTYRVLGTFEYLAPDVQAMDLAGAQLVTVSAHGDVAQDLDLYVIQ